MLVQDLLKQYTPNGCQTLSKMANRYPACYPKALSHGQGQNVFDVDGRKYVDLIAGLGVISLGYANEDVNNAAYSQLSRGVSFSLPTMLEYEVAKRLCELVPFTEQWKFSKNGSDVTTMAVKAARAMTGREKVKVCGYHGWHDWYTVATDKKAGILPVLDQYVNKALYNNSASFMDLWDKEYAAVIMEPYVFEEPDNGFLESVRRICDATGTVLIFDEIVTGGRTREFCASSFYAVEPDFITLSKGIANGFPLSAVGGKRANMAVFERDDFFASGSYSGETVSLAAGLKTLDILPAKIPYILETGNYLKNWFDNFFAEYGGKARGYAGRIDFTFKDASRKWLFWQQMCKHGILVGYSNFVMADMNSSFGDVIEAMRRTANDFKNPNLTLEGPTPFGALVR